MEVIKETTVSPRQVAAQCKYSLKVIGFPNRTSGQRLTFTNKWWADVIVQSSLVPLHKTSHQYCKWASSRAGWSGAGIATAQPKYEKYREKLWLGAIQELHSALISSDKTGPLFKGEVILNIDGALGIYTQGLGTPIL